ncbi:MAG: hypothetical protein JW816_02340 [Candidatus Buchananbacteria bacterium]|nr:hypothetical protein [Candidatus Buchananbacteria bacterium]
MSLINLGLVLIVGLNFGLAFLIWSINKKNKISISFSLPMIVILAWFVLNKK